MEVEKSSAKGGFFQFFDWNAKSRKKLFCSKSELSAETSNSGKLNFQVPATYRFQQDLENGFGSSTRGQNNVHYASSENGDSEYGTKAPGVVARLMGLESLPTSSTDEPHFNSFVESHSFRDLNSVRATPAFQSEHDIVIFESVRNKLDGLTRNPLDPRVPKVQNRPVERFQTEVLPPKSVKPISITQHKLLSPIKSPGFIPPKNAAYIIEAAAKLIEQSPRSAIKVKLPSVGSSSVHFRVQDLREKTDSTRRSSRSADVPRKDREYSSTKHPKKQVGARGQGQSKDSYLYRGDEEVKESLSQRSRSRERPVSDQVNVNIRKRDGSSVVCNRSSEKQKERGDEKFNRASTGQQNILNRVVHKSSSRGTSDVLTPNHQKQNCASGRDGDNYEPLISHSSNGKEFNLSTTYNSQRPRRTVNKIVVDNVVQSKKTKTVSTELGKDVPLSKTTALEKKKVSINGSNHSDVGDAQKLVVAKDETSIRRNITIDDSSNLNANDKKHSLDVVSFTFTSPIKKSESGSNSRFNFASGDALSVLLEQKLKELSCKVESSQQSMSGATSFSSSVSNCRTGLSANFLHSSLEDDVCKGKREDDADSNIFSVDKLYFEEDKKDLGLVDMEGKNNSTSEHRKYHSLRGVIQVSNQPSFSGVTCDSSDTGRSSSAKQLSVESCYGVNWTYSKKSRPADLDLETSDTASSLSVGAMSESITSSSYATHSKDSSDWELQYIVDILGNAEPMFEEFALGQTHKPIAPCLFDQLENEKMETNKLTQEPFTLQRKVLFDCVNKCLEFRCRRLLSGCWKAWAKQTARLHRKQWLAEELLSEISSWANLEELMVDELVDKDMSSNHGKWVDFEIEASEEGVEIENRILTSLVNEVVDDFFQVFL